MQFLLNMMFNEYKPYLTDPLPMSNCCISAHVVVKILILGDFLEFGLNFFIWVRHIIALPSTIAKIESSKAAKRKMFIQNWRANNNSLT